MNNLLSTEEIQEKLSVDMLTLHHFRQLGMPYIKISHKIIRYDLDDVMAWVKGRHTKETAAEKE